METEQRRWGQGMPMMPWHDGALDVTMLSKGLEQVVAAHLDSRGWRIAVPVHGCVHVGGGTLEGRGDWRGLQAHALYTLPLATLSFAGLGAT